MKSNAVLPHLSFMLISEEAYFDEQGRLVIIDVLRHIVWAHEPSQMPPYHTTPKVVLCMYSEDESAAYDVTLSMEFPNGRVAEVITLPIGFYDGTFKPTRIIPLEMVLPTPGVFWFRAYIGSRLWGQYPLKLTYHPEHPQ